MNKFLLGLTAVFAMSVAVPAFAAEKDDKAKEEKPKDEKPAKEKHAKEKHPKKKPE
jgi:hypothetical protein